uniref:Uncharacterized protein n=1 Tax=Anguilla anguilla TaxID=7936 RepID=A0A0E9UCL3_ANGAN
MRPEAMANVNHATYIQTGNLCRQVHSVLRYIFGHCKRKREEVYSSHTHLELLKAVWCLFVFNKNIKIKKHFQKPGFSEGQSAHFISWSS